MARRQVIEVLCDRCKRVESIPADQPGASAPSGPIVQLRVFGKTAEYTDLCSKCKSAIETHFLQIIREYYKKDKEEGGKKPGITSLLGGKQKV